MKRRHLLVGAGALTSLSLTNTWQKPIMAQSNPENSAAVPQQLETVLQKAIESSEANSITVSDLEVIGFNAQTALAFVTLREADSPSTSVTGTRTLVLQTSNGGDSWNVTLNTNTGSVVTDESFFLRKDDSDEITNIWMVTQWQIEATFPTLYSTKDFGKTWQQSNAVQDFLNSKGHNTVNYAQGLRFRNENEGIIVAKANDSEVKIYFLQTQDGGRTWKEIPSVPSWYFETINQNWRDNNLWMVNQKDDDIFISKEVGSLLKTLRSSL
jgi:hypothetical protein